MRNTFRWAFAGQLFLGTLCFTSPWANVHAQGTAFTYQGQLNAGGTPANGSYDLEFSLFPTGAGGSAVSGPVTNAAVTVSNGLFTTSVDFGIAFTGASEWLEIAVSPHGSNLFTTLAPRQQLTPVPYAGFAESAGTFGGAINGSQITSNSITTTQLAPGAVASSNIAAGAIGAGQLSPSIGVWTREGANISYTPGFVGLGTTGPDRPLTVQGAGQNGEWISLANTNGVTRWHLNNLGSGLNFAQTDVADYRLFLSTNGNVGVGVSGPQSKLHVAGDVLMTGLIYGGAVAGTAQAPIIIFQNGTSTPAGLVVRRLNSISNPTSPPPSNTVVAVCPNFEGTGNLQLVRDGTDGGFQIKYPATVSTYTINCSGMDDTGAQKNFYSGINASTNGMVQIYSDSQNIVHFECTFGDTFNDGHQTQVTLSRVAGDYYWTGYLISSYNQ
jgi:hypothetical protein